MKSTTETSYLDVYIQLCQNLFKKFNDPENEEMNFKRLLLNRCEKQFTKMMVQEQANRRSRKQSMDEAAKKQKNIKDLKEDYTNTMVFAYGEEELMQRQREQMHGNMRFLVELFKLKLVRGVLIRDCLEDLFQELNDGNVEVLCNMLDTLTKF